MIAALYRYVSTIPSVVIDGALYVGIAVFGALLAFFSSDDAYKYINPYFLFWAKGTTQALLASTSALKMFRSTSYSDHQTNKQTETKTP